MYSLLFLASLIIISFTIMFLPLILCPWRSPLNNSLSIYNDLFIFHAVALSISHVIKTLWPGKAMTVLGSCTTSKLLITSCRIWQYYLFTSHIHATLRSICYKHTNIYCPSHWYNYVDIKNCLFLMHWYIA